MGLETTIQNVGEYFSAHYLAGKDGFNKDIGEHVKRWKEQGSQATPRKLQALGEAFFAAKSEALDYAEPELRGKAIGQGSTKDLHRWHPQLLQALGYQQESVAIALDTEQKHLPALLRLHRHSQPWLAVLQAPFCLNSGDCTEEALEAFVEATSLVDENQQSTPPLQCEWEKAIALLFKQEDRPRWAILLAGSKIYLFDAHTYAQGRYIYIDLDAAYSSKDKNAFEAMAALLSHECLAPSTESDEVLHEKLREGSLKQTHAVSESLQGAVREAIELIANGWIEQRRAQSRGYKQLGEREQPLPDGSREVTAEQLKHDALVYVYRILFCLYAEARGGELGVLPITDDVYRLGYSLEALRDLADMGEPGTQTEDGSYYAEHLNRLFQLVHEGFHPEEAEVKEQAEGSNAWLIQLPEQNDLFGSTTKQLSLNKSGRKQLATGNSRTFVIQPLTATLFAPKATPLLNRVLLSNRVLHQVIRRLSLGTGSKSKQIGRINYAELGIVQLGSVYEGLLSYKGFFAKENLIQVVKAGKPKKVKGKNEIPVVYDDAINPKEPSWFVPEQRLADFKEGEVVIERRTKQPRIYRQGEFILHLNGVDRVNSASYYTPEVLTRALVKEALKERLKDFGAEQADEILQLKICEPAMGSAAFLVEAIDQLARRYLVLKQEQLGEQIDPSRFEEELGRVKHYIAVHNVYGVDLNPTAVELGALSLWLASIHSLRVQEGENGSADIYRPGQTPWFGLRLRAGNSLIGARRAVWTYDQLATGKHYGKKALAPRQLKPSEQRRENEIYHFLVWDEDMAPAARDKLMKSHWKDECSAINEWNKKQVRQDWSPEELAQARDICQKIDELWQDYAHHRAVGLEQTECTASVWPEPANSTQALKPGPSLEFQEQVKANLEAQSGAFQRLKLLMDSWCSFYFWPLERSEDLPSRAAWLAAAELLLGCEAVESEQARANLDFTLGEDIQLEALFAESQQQLPDAGRLAAAVPWFGLAREINNSQNFHHWELIFTEILGPSRKSEELQDAEETEKPEGFDLIFGNPPWDKVEWKDAVLLSEFDALLGVRESKSPDVEKARPTLLSNSAILKEYSSTFNLAIGNATFLNDTSLYPELAGVQTNLYKNFLEVVWRLTGLDGMSALLHPPGCFDSPGGGDFRASCYKRLRSHIQFSNQLMWFPDIGHRNTFSINLYGEKLSGVSFWAIFNVFHPITIERSFSHNTTLDPIPGLKDEYGHWNLKGHSRRIIQITNAELELFSSLLDEEGTKTEMARLPQIHSDSFIRILEKLSGQSSKLASIQGDYHCSDMFHETNSQRDGLIVRQENPSFQPIHLSEWVISGPHFFVGNLFYKTPRKVCTEKGHYDQIDLSTSSNKILPRAVYKPGSREGDLSAYLESIPEWPKPSAPFLREDGEWEPGFWPISDEQYSKWESILGEDLRAIETKFNVAGKECTRKFLLLSKGIADFDAVINFVEGYSDELSEYDIEAGDSGLVIQVNPENYMFKCPQPYTWRYRYANREMAQPANERSLIPCLLPKGPSHIYTAFSIAFLDERKLIRFLGGNLTIVNDFVVRLSGRGHCRHDLLKQFSVDYGKVNGFIESRTLRLCCLAECYSEIWNSLFDENMKTDLWAIDKANYIDQVDWLSLSGEWSADFAICNDYLRRVCQVELDVLVSISLGLSVEELIQIYSVQFAVLNTYENADMYDQQGQRLPNTTRKDAGAKELREALKSHDAQSPITVSWEIDNGLQAVTKTFHPPFKHVDRIEDYKTAYRVFSERLGLNKNNETME